MYVIPKCLMSMVLVLTAAFSVAFQADGAPCGCIWEVIRAAEAAHKAKDSAALARHVTELNTRYWDDQAGWFRLRPDADSPHDLWASACTMTMPLARWTAINRMLKDCATRPAVLLKDGDLPRFLPGESSAGACACMGSRGAEAIGCLVRRVDRPYPWISDRVFAAQHARGVKTVPGEKAVLSARAVARIRLDTPWTKGVTPENAWRTYPRPQMELMRKGLCGSIYCETTDVFWEGGGFVTFDRQVEKLPAELLKPLNDAIVKGL